MSNTFSKNNLLKTSLDGVAPFKVIHKVEMSQMGEKYDAKAILSNLELFH